VFCRYTKNNKIHQNWHARLPRLMMPTS